LLRINPVLVLSGGAERRESVTPQSGVTRIRVAQSVVTRITRITRIIEKI
jgi:hypothetical protein